MSEFLSPERDQVQQFAEVLHGRRNGTPSEAVVAFIKKGTTPEHDPYPDGTEVIYTPSGWPGDEPGWNSYLAVNRFRPDRTSDREAKDVVLVAGTWADLDVKPGARPDGSGWPHDTAELAKVIEALPQPTVLVDTGTGNLHPYWLFEEMHADTEACTQLLKRWHEFVNRVASRVLDRPIRFDTVTNLDRVMKLPGTVRWPKGDEDPAPVRLLHCDGPRYTPSRLWKLSEPPEQPEADEAVPVEAAPLPVPEHPRIKAYIAKAIERAAGELSAMEPDTGRNNALNTAAISLGGYEPYGIIDRDTVRDALHAACEANGLNGEDGERQFESTFASGWDAGQAKPSKIPDWMRTLRARPEGDQFEDAFLAETLAQDVLVGAYRYVARIGWKAWTGRVWRDCDVLEVGEDVRQWAGQQYRAALSQEQAEPGSVPMDVLKGWRKTLSASKQDTVLKKAAGVSGVFTDPTELDAYPDLLNTPSGVVDLTTGALRPSDPDLLMTKIARVGYRPGYTHPDWDMALQALPEDVRDWYQLRVGQAATGHMTPDAVMVVSHGAGENGKTVLNTGTARALGDYYTLLSDRVLMADPSAHPTELMDLMGVRYAVLEETPEARRLDTQRLKRTIGTPQITARRIRQDPVTFDAVHSLFVSTNYRPEITETDHGSWRRVALLTFPYTFRKPGERLIGPNDRHGDPGLLDRVMTDPDVWAAALTWMVEGARRWYEGRKQMPPLPVAVEADTLAWRLESDMALGFIREHLVHDPERYVLADDLTHMVNAWLRGRGLAAWSDKTVAARLGAHDEFVRHHVLKRDQRLNDRVSRPETDPFDTTYPVRTVPTASKVKKAWIGVRWRTSEDDEGAQEAG